MRRRWRRGCANMASWCGISASHGSTSSCASAWAVRHSARVSRRRSNSCSRGMFKEEQAMEDEIEVEADVLDAAGCGVFWDAVKKEEARLRGLDSRELVDQLNEWLEPLAPDIAAEVCGEKPARR